MVSSGCAALVQLCIFNEVCYRTVRCCSCDRLIMRAWNGSWKRSVRVLLGEGSILGP